MIQVPGIREGNYTMKYYAVRVGHVPGIYTDWPTASHQVSGYKGAVFKSFSTRTEAENFMNPDIGAKVATASGEILTAYTDGSCVKQVGGYGFLVLQPSGEGGVKEYHGRVPYKPCTNQIAELYAIYRLLETLEGQEPVIHIRSDSMYAIQCLTNYIGTWRKNGFVTSTGSPVKNQELIRDIDALLQRFTKVTFEHVYAHRGEEYNERVDKLANLGRMEPGG